MAERKQILVEDLSLLGALLEKEGTIRSLVSSTSLDKELIKKRVMALRRLGLISTKSEATRTYILTPLGRRLAETRDVHLVEPYSFDEKISPELGFKFAVGDGLYTGDVALSYREFTELIGKVDARSLAFHLYRGDFETWIVHVYGNGGKRIASRLRRLVARTMPPDHLRSRLVRIFSEELSEEQQDEEGRLESKDGTLEPKNEAPLSNYEIQESAQDEELDGEP